MKKTKIEGMKIFKINNEEMNFEDEQTKKIIEEALDKKPLKVWENELKINKSNILLSNEEGDLIQAATFINKGEIFAGIAPNLIQLYFDLAYEQNNISNKYVNTFQYIATNKFENIKLIESPIFTRFIQHRISAIIFLHLSVEAFINYIIPDDFIYSKIETSNSNKFQEQITRYNKENIERWISFKEKIEEIIPQLPNNDFNIDKNSNIIGRILEVEKIRNEIIHLKSKDSNSNLYYKKVFDFVASKDLDIYVSSVKKFINIQQKDFIKFIKIKTESQTKEIFVNSEEHLNIGLYFEIIRQKEQRITILINKWKGLTKKCEYFKIFLSYLKLMEDMNFIVDYLISEENSKFKIEIFKDEEQIK